jgi:tetratricopeptide (TPR) repeat protein
MAYLSRGVAYLRIKETDLALDDFNKAISANDKNGRAYYYRGMVWMLKDDFEKAVSDFTKALDLKKPLATAKFARATAYARLEKYDEAAADLRAVLPQMEANVQSFADSYGIVRTEMWKVMAQLSGETRTPTLDLTPEEVETVKKWLVED